MYTVTDLGADDIGWPGFAAISARLLNTTKINVVITWQPLGQYHDAKIRAEILFNGPARGQQVQH